MTPAARLAAAADVLDSLPMKGGAEAALARWGRGARYAGSGDREAVRDLVYEVLRRRRSLAALGGGNGGRQLVHGLMRLRGTPELVSSTDRHGLPAPDASEAARLARPPGPELDALPEPVALDIPDWLEPLLRDGLGATFVPVLRAGQDRAPVFLRAHPARVTAARAAELLAAEGIAATPHPRVPTALRLAAHPRRLRQTRAFLDGLVELQDLSSQEAVAVLPDPQGRKVLDLCAGAGGKTLALAARGAGAPGQGGGLWAHDIDQRRMRDLPERAARAGARVRILPPGGASEAAPYDLVLADVPCSGSGTWRRDPEAKWRLTADRLDALLALQRRLLAEAAALVAPEGVLAYTTCSVLRGENEAQIAAFLGSASSWRLKRQVRFGHDGEGDGFFVSLLIRD